MHGAERQPEIRNSQKPLLTIVVIFHDMQREAERTLYSLSTKYQDDVSDSDYEVIAIDNGSQSKLSEDRVCAFGPNFEFRYVETDSVSPVGAVNLGVRSAAGEYVAVIVDGARMATPCLVSATLKCLQLDRQPFVCALAWHLGPDVQRIAMEKGYNRSEEDKLLDSIDWQNNGYRLFEIATIAPSSANGFLGGMPTECSWFAMRRATFLDMNGFDERFQSPGGGYVNHDFLDRVLQRPQFDLYVLLGEGTFHQIHGGVATNSQPGKHPTSVFKKEYRRIRNKSFETRSGDVPIYFGKMPREAARFVCDDYKEV